MCMASRRYKTVRKDENAAVCVLNLKSAARTILSRRYRVGSVIGLLGHGRDHRFRFYNCRRTEIVEPRVDLLFDHAGLFIHENFDSHRLWHLTYSFLRLVPLATILDPLRSRPYSRCHPRRGGARSGLLSSWPRERIRRTTVLLRCFI